MNKSVSVDTVRTGNLNGDMMREFFTIHPINHQVLKCNFS